MTALASQQCGSSSIPRLDVVGFTMLGVGHFGKRQKRAHLFLHFLPKYSFFSVNEFATEIMRLL